MCHSDDVGLVLPPAIAPVQVVIIPIAPGQSTGANGTAPSTEAVVATAEQLRGRLAAAGVRCRVDGDVGKPPGGRFYAWERKVREAAPATPRQPLASLRSRTIARRVCRCESRWGLVTWQLGLSLCAGA